MNSGDTAWMLIASALVLLMTPGLAFFYGGLVRRKSVLGVIMHSVMCMGLVSIVWVLWGYSLAFGPGNNLIGDFSYVALKGVSAVEAGPYSATIPHMTFMIFQCMFAIITPALITGAFAERMKFSAFCIFTVLWLTLVYAPMAHWVWAGGWLADRGILDFAGGAVVHMNAGLAALAAALIIGKRLRHGLEPFDSHNVPFVVLGAGLLWFGWFGFNAGSALTSGGSATLAFVVTNTATAAATLTWVGLAYVFTKKASAIGAASGAVAGLVAITPASGFVGPMASIVIGIGAGAVCFAAVYIVRKMKIDDALDVFAVHGIGGTWGSIATGLFVGMGTAGAYTIGTLGKADRMEQVLAQVIGIVATWVFSFVATGIILLALKYTIGIRVDEKTEEEGLDTATHGEPAYPATSPGA